MKIALARPKANLPLAQFVENYLVLGFAGFLCFSGTGYCSHYSDWLVRSVNMELP